MVFEYEFEAVIKNVELGILVVYIVHEGDEGSYWQPPEPDEIEILDIMATSIIGETYTYNMADVADWQDDLDRLAEQYVLEQEGNLDFEMFENANDHLEDF